MTVSRATNMEIRYYPGKIELVGESEPIQAEAQKILLRFAYSATPYRVVEHHDDHIVLVANDDRA